MSDPDLHPVGWFDQKARSVRGLTNALQAPKGSLPNTKYLYMYHSTRFWVPNVKLLCELVQYWISSIFPVNHVIYRKRNPWLAQLSAQNRRVACSVRTFQQGIHRFKIEKQTFIVASCFICRHRYIQYKGVCKYVRMIVLSFQDKGLPRDTFHIIYTIEIRSRRTTVSRTCWRPLCVRSCWLATKTPTNAQLLATELEVSTCIQNIISAIYSISSVHWITNGVLFFSVAWQSRSSEERRGGNSLPTTDVKRASCDHGCHTSG